MPLLEHSLGHSTPQWRVARKVIFAIEFDNGTTDVSHRIRSSSWNFNDMFFGNLVKKRNVFLAHSPVH